MCENLTNSQISRRKFVGLNTLVIAKVAKYTFLATCGVVSRSMVSVFTSFDSSLPWSRTEQVESITEDEGRVQVRLKEKEWIACVSPITILSRFSDRREMRLNGETITLVIKGMIAPKGRNDQWKSIGTSPFHTQGKVDLEAG